MIFVCPECGDLGCGAITCEVIREADTVVWQRFGFENDYDEKMSDFDSYSSIGLFRFDREHYRELLARAV